MYKDCCGLDGRNDFGVLEHATSQVTIKQSFLLKNQILVSIDHVLKCYKKVSEVFDAD